VAEAGVRDWGARGGPFIGARGREGGERWRAPASSPRRGWWRTVVTMRRLGQGRGDGMARLAQETGPQGAKSLLGGVMVRRRGGGDPRRSRR
jgi:hypothetical protein